ncbi:MAG TPA: hypothetical protein VD866_30030 [Urbifossiella sp.]|nr:hypothetical protein [Urbifossiella sp.]
MNCYARGFRWAVVIGILQDWLFAIPGIVIPHAVLLFAGADPVPQPVWPAYAFLLLLLLSLVYIPAAVDPYKYSFFAALTVLARVAGVIFFFVIWPGAFPPLPGYIDLGLTVVQGTLLLLAFVTAGPVVPPVPVPTRR